MTKLLPKPDPDPPVIAVIVDDPRVKPGTVVEAATGTVVCLTVCVWSFTTIEDPPDSRCIVVGDPPLDAGIVMVPPGVRVWLPTIKLLVVLSLLSFTSLSPILADSDPGSEPESDPSEPPVAGTAVTVDDPIVNTGTTVSGVVPPPDWPFSILLPSAEVADALGSLAPPPGAGEVVPSDPLVVLELLSLLVPPFCGTVEDGAVTVGLEVPGRLVIAEMVSPGPTSMEDEGWSSSPPLTPSMLELLLLEPCVLPSPLPSPLPEECCVGLEVVVGDVSGGESS